MSFRIVLAARLVLGVPALLQAQYPYNNRRAQPGWQPAEFQGKIQGVARGNMVIVDPTNRQIWKVAVLPATKVQVTGTATPDALRSGLIVEFTADIDDRGAIQGKVDTLAITTLTNDKSLGLVPAAAKSDDVSDGFGANGGDKPAAPHTANATHVAKKQPPAPSPPAPIKSSDG